MEYSISEINKIGEVLRKKDPLPRDTYYKKFTHFLTKHNHSISFFLKIIDIISKSDNVISIASRLKRRKAITDKLIREKGMRLHRMQDISGIRIIVKNFNDIGFVRDTVIKLLESSDENVEFINKATKKYHQYPKKDGYRSLHLIFKYKNLRTEVQIRTQTQHHFATAVEILNWKHSLYENDTKNQKKCKILFIISKILYLSNEKGSSNRYFHKKIRNKYKEDFNEIYETLKAIKILNIRLSRVKKDFIILRKRKGSDSLMIEKECDDERDAIDTYMMLQEKEDSDSNIVLLRNTSSEEAQKNYPNYFESAQCFVKLLEGMLKEGIAKPSVSKKITDANFFKNI